MPAKARVVLATLLLLCSPLPAGATPGSVGTVAIEGRTLESPERLKRFLGLLPGTPYADATALRERVEEALRQLGYQTLSARWEEVGDHLQIALSLAPAQVVRHVRVRGNWPVFDEEITRRLTLRPGSRLPPKVELSPLLDRESERIKDYLMRHGYFDGDVDIVVKPAGRPDWVDLDVLVHLGRWVKLWEVEGSGNRVLGNRDLLGYFGARWYQLGWLGRFQQDALRDDARDAEREYRDRGYPAARVLPEFDPARDLDAKSGRARLRVQVLEKARVNIKFLGNHALSERQLLGKVTLFSAGSYDDVELAESAKELFRLYQANGYLEARVGYKRQTVGEVVEITFEIEEGPELRVRRVEFLADAGAAPLTVDERTLAGLVATRVFPRLGDLGLGAGGFVTSVQLAQDVDKLVAFERARGFPEARVRGELSRDPEAFGRVGVLAADLAVERGRGDLFVRFYLDEGRRERIAGVRLRYPGEHQSRADELVAVLSIQRGDPFSVEALRAAIRRIPEYFAARGHPYAQVAPPVLSWNEDHTAVEVELSVDEGPEVRFGEILVRGNFKTADWVVRRNLPFAPGDRFDITRITQGERNLQTHAIFNGVRVIPLGLTQMVNPVPILVEIQQERFDNWGEFVASVGYSTDVGLSLLPGYYWGNVFGGGGNLELRLELAVNPSQALPSSVLNYSAPFYRRLSASLRYVHPHLIWPSLRAEAAGFVRKEDTVRLGEVDSAGASTSLSWVYSPRFRLFGRLDWTSSTLQSISFQRLPGRGDSTSAVPDQTQTGKLTLGVVFDDRVSFDGAKNPLMPISGTLLAASVALASKALLGNHDFFVASGQVQRYQPLGAGISLIGNLRGDWGVPIGEAALPAVDRFFAGGDVATRGYNTDSLRTEIRRYDVSPAGGGAGFQIVPQGGNVRFLATVELQFPIATIVGYPWNGALFLDAGTIFDRAQLFDFAHDVKASVGLTLLRILTPVGPISLEYAYPITQGPAEQTWKAAPWYGHWPGLIHFNWGIPILR